MEQISGSGTSFLERVLCTQNSQVLHATVLLCFPQNSLFSLVLIFPSLYVKSLRSQTLLIGGPVWNNKCKCQFKEVHMHFRLAAIVLGFPKSCASARLTCAKPPPRLAQVFCHVSELVPARHMANAMCRAGIISDTWP